MSCLLRSEEESKQFFFEKKNQKTLKMAQVARFISKFFLVLFF